MHGAEFSFFLRIIFLPSVITNLIKLLVTVFEENTMLIKQVRPKYEIQ